MNINLTKSGATYSTKRSGYYPTIAEQLDLLYHDIDSGTLTNKDNGTLYAALKAVKDKYPK